jgi:cytidylate kinase
MKNFIITIARTMGSGGKQIGMNLAQKLGIPCYESQILSMASEYSGINVKNFVLADEKLSGNRLINLLKSAPSTDELISPNDKNFVSDQNLFNFQARIIKDLANNESCVIIGKCANFVLRDFYNVVSVFIHAPRKTCIGSLIDRMGVTDDEATKMVDKTNKYRADYIRYYTQRPWDDPEMYDIMVNTEKVGREKSVDLIASLVEIKFGTSLN